MPPRNLVPLLAAVALLGSASAAPALVIDDFSDVQSLSVVGILTNDFNQVSGGMLGGERDGFMQLTAGTSASADIVGGVASHQESGGSDSDLRLVWDGPDNAPTLDHEGLPSVDFTEGGTQNALTFQIQLNTLAATLSFLAYTTASEWSRADFTAPAGASAVTVLFSDFVAQAGSGADFTNIGALALFSDPGTAAQSLDFGVLQTTSVPEPSSAALLALGLALLGARRRGGSRDEPLWRDGRDSNPQLPA